MINSNLEKIYENESENHRYVDFNLIDVQQTYDDELYCILPKNTTLQKDGNEKRIILKPEIQDLILDKLDQDFKEIKEKGIVQPIKSKGEWIYPKKSGLIYYPISNIHCVRFPKEVMDELDLDWYWNLVSDINNYIDKKFLKKEVPIFEKKENIHRYEIKTKNRQEPLLYIRKTSLNGEYAIIQYDLIYCRYKLTKNCMEQLRYWLDMMYSDANKLVKNDHESLDDISGRSKRVDLKTIQEYSEFFHDIIFDKNNYEKRGTASL